MKNVTANPRCERQPASLPRLATGSYFGDKRKILSLDGLILAETVFPPNLVIPTHTHTNAFFCLVVRGSSTGTSRARTRTCDASILTFHPAGEAHGDIWHDVGGECFTLELDTPWRDRLADYGICLEQPADFEGGLPLFLAQRLYAELRQADDVSPLAIEGLALELVAASVRRRAKPSTSRTPPWLERARDLLHERFADALSLSTVALAVDIHPAHLARCFRQHYGCSVGDYVRRLRVEFARRQIVTSNGSLAEIAVAAGFADQSHFTKTFKRLVGMTPARYRTTFCEAADRPTG
jgi:AraC family transcriptional regulator